VASVSFDSMSTIPNRMKFVARVATNDGTFNNTVIMPLIIPTPAATKSEASMAQPTEGPAARASNMTQACKEHLSCGEVDLPSTSTSTSPTAIAPTGAAKPAAAFKLREVRKFEESTEKKMKSATVMMIGVTSRCATKALQR